MAPTFQKADMADATRYALQTYAQKDVIQMFQNLGVPIVTKEVPWDLPSVNRLKKNAVLDKKFEFEFAEEGCKLLHCYQYVGNGHCRERAPLNVFDGENRYEACQSICKKMKVPFSVFWCDGECKLNNPLLESYALRPNIRTNSKASYEKVPPYAYDRHKQTCRLSQVYCNKYGMDLVGDKCVERGSFKFSEFIFGKTITRAFSNATYSVLLNQWNEIAAENAPAVEETPVVSKKSFRPLAFQSPAQFKRKEDQVFNAIEGDEYYNLGETTTRVITDLLKFIAETLGIVLGLKTITATVGYVSTLLSNIAFDRLLPTALYEAAIAASAAVEAVLSNGYVLAVTGALSTVGEIVASVLDPLLIIILIANVIGLVVDSVDPLHLHSELKTFTTQEILDTIAAYLKDKYAYIFKGESKYTNLIGVTPLLVWSANRDKDAKDPDRLKFILEKSSHYLLALEFNALGQRLDFKDEPKVNGVMIKSQPVRHKISDGWVESLFKPPETNRKIAWSMLLVGMVTSGTLYLRHLFIGFLIPFLIAFVVLATDIIYWWTRNNSITGNMLYVYDPFEYN